MTLGEERVDDDLEDGNEDQNEDWVEGLHLVRLDLQLPKLAIHAHCLQCPPGTLCGGVAENGVKGREEGENMWFNHYININTSQVYVHVYSRIQLCTCSKHLLIEEGPKHWKWK